MDLLGKNGEQAVEDIKDVEDRISKLESHLNGVDSALQDFMDNYSGFLEDELDYQEHEIEQIKQVIAAEEKENPEIDGIKGRIDNLERKQSQLDSLLRNDLMKNIEGMVTEIKQNKKSINSAKNDIGELEQRIEALEASLIKEKNNKEFDLNKKLNRRDYTDDRKTIMAEIKKLKTSVHVLAEDMDDKDKIEIE